MSNDIDNKEEIVLLENEINKLLEKIAEYNKDNEKKYEIIDVNQSPKMSFCKNLIFSIIGTFFFGSFSTFYALANISLGLVQILMNYFVFLCISLFLTFGIDFISKKQCKQLENHIKINNIQISNLTDELTKQREKLSLLKGKNKNYNTINKVNDIESLKKILNKKNLVYMKKIIQSYNSFSKEEKGKTLLKK